MITFVGAGPGAEDLITVRGQRLLQDADIVVWNPDTEWTLSAEDQQSACDYCPMEGTTIRGRAEQVYLRGTLAAENGKILAEKAGTYVRHGAE